MNKIIMLLITALFIGQSSFAAAGGGDDQSNPSTAVGDAQRRVLGERSICALLERILEETGLDPRIIPLVCKNWNKAAKNIYQYRYKFLVNRDIPRIMNSIQLPGNAVPKYKNSKIFERLYVELARQAGRPATRPDTDTTDPQLLLYMAQDAERIQQDENLGRAWPIMREAIAAATPATGATMPALDATPETIRGWLRNDANQAAILQVGELFLYNIQLTSLPEEVALFVNLQRLSLSDNQLAAIDIPDTLVRLINLSLNNNQLAAIDIPNTLVNLQYLFLSDNQLAVIDIPNTLVNLQLLSLSNNQLAAIDIPNTLVDLRTLHLSSNQLAVIDIPNNVNLIDLYLDNNQLTAIDLTNNLRILVLFLGNNQLTPGSIRIPAEIRARATIRGEADQRPVAE